MGTILRPPFFRTARPLRGFPRKRRHKNMPLPEKFFRLMQSIQNARPLIQCF